ncbi:methylated-DNA--[protein]-cysteine S-methyltransferase [Patescibacteria group bacterium]|nr:methylated-DNA--[protein]-cysteine S-methyltransferase [Patescibacteria group bacterium]
MKTEIHYSFFKTLFGLCLVASTENGICNVLFADTQEDARKDLQSRWKGALLLKKSQPHHKKILLFLKGNPSDVTLDVQGTSFQKKVWKLLQSIPKGKTSTYGALAKQLGDTKLSRAVGTAIGNNPIGYIIPCHRVIKSNGELSGFRWGVDRKRAMLSFEGVSHANK